MYASTEKASQSLMETVKQLKQKNKRLAERVELLEAIVQKISATEGKTYRANYVLHLKVCIKDKYINVIYRDCLLLLA